VIVKTHYNVNVKCTLHLRRGTITRIVPLSFFAGGACTPYSPSSDAPDRDHKVGVIYDYIEMSVIRLLVETTHCHIRVDVVVVVTMCHSFSSLEVAGRSKAGISDSLACVLVKNDVSLFPLISDTDKTVLVGLTLIICFYFDYC